MKDTDEEDVLEYGPLDEIEARFKGKPNTHIYDRQGFAGLEGDDDEAPSLDLPEEEEEMFQRKRASSFTNSTSNLPYPDFTKMIYPERDDEDKDELDNEGENVQHEVVVPYLHIDGRLYEAQIEIINTAKPLLHQNKIVVVGVEHSPDLDVHDLIRGFNEVMKFIIKRSFWDQDKSRGWIIYVLRYWMILLLILLYLLRTLIPSVKYLSN
mmetsp:Transcript_27957/g.40481  ORF Transcript_27957/g.40481 Transcript_27957/m.40481 type:complete len:210 (-) Transcript_27957:147-776(-)